MIEVTKQSDITIPIDHKIIRGFQKYVVEKTAVIAAQVITVVYVRLRVTTCLYLSPNNRARSLSTLIAVSITRDNPEKVIPEIKTAADT